MVKWKLVLCVIGSIIHFNVLAKAMELYFEGTFVDLGLVDPAIQSFELLGKHVSGSIKYETELIPLVQLQGTSPGFGEGYIYAGTDPSGGNFSGAAIDEWMTIEVFIDGKRQSLPIFSNDDYALGQLQHEDNSPIPGGDEHHDIAHYFYERRAPMGPSDQVFVLDLITGSDIDLNPIPGLNIPNLLDITSPFELSAGVLGVGLYVRPSTLGGDPILEPIAASFAIERLKLSVVVPNIRKVPLPAIASAILALVTLALFVFILSRVDRKMAAGPNVC